MAYKMLPSPSCGHTRGQLQAGFTRYCCTTADTNCSVYATVCLRVLPHLFIYLFSLDFTHQLHFDSENEGIGGVKNPIATFVLFLSDGTGKDGQPGHSPTLITNQAFGQVTQTLGTAKGHLAWPKANRAVCFRGNLLHGVVPGYGCTELVGCADASGGGASAVASRHTLMVSFWKELKCRPWVPSEPTKPGSCRPVKGCQLPWADKVRLRKGVGAGSANGGHEWLLDGSSEESLPPSRTAAQPVARVWEGAGGAELKPGAASAVPYPQVFQW
jgi:hypothetical protein